MGAPLCRSKRPAFARGAIERARAAASAGDENGELPSFFGAVTWKNSGRTGSPVTSLFSGGNQRRVGIEAQQRPIHAAAYFAVGNPGMALGSMMTSGIRRVMAASITGPAT